MSINACERALPVLAILAASMIACVADIPSGQGTQGIVALFDPSQNPPVVPTPTDLIRVGGKLQVPLDPSEADPTSPTYNGALHAFNEYLRGLDGYPPDSTISASFSGDVDPASLAEWVMVYDGTDQVLLSSAQAAPGLAPGETARMTVQNTQRWKSGHTYLVTVLSYSEGTALRGVVGKKGERVLPDQAFLFLRSTQPLAGLCADPQNTACACTDLRDPACHAVVDGLSDAQARQLEGARKALSPLLDQVLKLVGRRRQDVALAFSFTISSRPFAVFDLARGQVPFPSDLLLKNPLADQTTVDLPISPNDSPLQKALKTGLNTLDGFSTTGSAIFSIDAVAGANNGPPAGIDPATVTQKSALLLNITPATLQNQPRYTPQAQLLPAGSVSKPAEYAVQVALSPDTALLDQNRYAALVTTDIKDKNGAPLTPSPLTVLLTQPAPLVINGKSAVPVLALADAQQLEVLRSQAIAPLVQALVGNNLVQKGQIAGLSVFRTQSILAPLLQLQALPATAPLPTAVIIDHIEKTLPAGFDQVGAVVHGRMTVLQVVGDLAPFNLQMPQPKQIPFVMALPKRMGATKAKVVIAQHGLGGWRGDVLLMANTLSASGLALIAIDVIYHGARAVCRADADCTTGGTCKGTPAGQCTTALLPEMGALQMPGSNAVKPSSVFPNRDFNNLANLFATRDNYRQHVIDLTQLVRVLQDPSATGLSAQLLADATLPLLDTTTLGYAGQSLGALLGTNFLSVNPDVNTGVLDVGGGRLVDIFTDPTSVFSAQVVPFLTSLGVQPGTAESAQLLDTLRWVLDPGDPINLARHVRVDPAQNPLTMRKNAPKHVILQEAGKDMVIPNEWTRRLGLELGLPLDGLGHLQGIDKEGSGLDAPVSTFYASGDHGMLLDFTNPRLTLSVQAQAATYLATGLSGMPPQILPPPAN